MDADREAGGTFAAKRQKSQVEAISYRSDLCRGHRSGRVWHLVTRKAAPVDRLASFGPGMRRDVRGTRKGDSRLSRTAGSPSLPHPALVALVRLLARSAAREAAPDIRGTKGPPPQ